MKHRPKKFFLSGMIADDSGLAIGRSGAERWILKEMREQGFVPMLAMEPIWTILKQKNDAYKFELSMYAVYVGKDEAWTIEGMDSDGKMLPRTIQPRLNSF